LPEFELPKPKQIEIVKAVLFTWQHRNQKGELIAEGLHRNDLIPNSGLSWVSSQLAGNASGRGTVIVLGTGSATPTMGDETLGGEITGSGLTRTTGSTSGVGAVVETAPGGTTNQTTGSFFVFNTFTASGTVTPNEGGVGPSMQFNSGVVTRDLLSPAPAMVAGDTLFTQFQFIL
jgi:hypothetical protein